MKQSWFNKKCFRVIGNGDILLPFSFLRKTVSALTKSNATKENQNSFKIWRRQYLMSGRIKRISRNRIWFDTLDYSWFQINANTIQNTSFLHVILYLIIYLCVCWLPFMFTFPFHQFFCYIFNITRKQARQFEIRRLTEPKKTSKS